MPEHQSVAIHQYRSRGVAMRGVCSHAEADASCTCVPATLPAAWLLVGRKSKRLERPLNGYSADGQPRRETTLGACRSCPCPGGALTTAASSRAAVAL